MELVDDITDQEAEDLARHLFDNFKGKLGKSIKNNCLSPSLSAVLKPPSNFQNTQKSRLQYFYIYMVYIGIESVNKFLSI